MSDKQQQAANLADVIKELEEKVEELPGNFVAHHHLAMVYHKAGRHNDAISELKKCIKIDDASAEAYINLGAIYFEMGKLDESLEANKKALIHAVNPAQAHCNIGLIHRGEVQCDDGRAMVGSVVGALRLEEIEWQGRTVKSPEIAEVLAPHWKEKLE